MNPSASTDFARQYQTHLKHLKLKGLQAKTINAYARGIRRMGAHFDHDIDDLWGSQLTDYFSALVYLHSWSAVKLDRYGFKSFGHDQIKEAISRRVVPANRACPTTGSDRGFARSNHISVRRLAETAMRCHPFTP